MAGSGKRIARLTGKTANAHLMPTVVVLSNVPRSAVLLRYSTV